MSTTHDVHPHRDLTTEDWRQEAFECDIGGWDDAGYLHIHDTERDKVVVLDENGIDFQHAIGSDEGPSNWGEWVDHVEDKRGWRVTWKKSLAGSLEGMSLGGEVDEY